MAIKYEMKPTILTKFDSELIPSKSISENHRLRIRLGLCLQKISTATNTFQDLGADGTRATGTAFTIRDWKEHEWFGFWRQVFDQSEHWNNKFWLIPTAEFSALDIVVGGMRYRPNIKCELFVQIWSNPGQAHKNIQVAKLADSYVGDNGIFRSDAVTYDSLDGVPHTFQIPDVGGTMLNITHYTIPHEIGHALGQPHIGVLRNTAMCKAAVVGNPADGGFSVGGSNSHRCYGWGEPPSISENIMGYGLKFDSVNAVPWQIRMSEHTDTLSSIWIPTMFDTPPKVVR